MMGTIAALVLRVAAEATMRVPVARWPVGVGRKTLERSKLWMYAIRDLSTAADEYDTGALGRCIWHERDR